jgi:hypothetical protein
MPTTEREGALRGDFPPWGLDRRILDGSTPENAGVPTMLTLAIGRGYEVSVGESMPTDMRPPRALGGDAWQ